MSYVVSHKVFIGKNTNRKASCQRDQTNIALCSFLNIRNQMGKKISRKIRRK